MSPPTATTATGTVGTVTGMTGSLVFDVGPIPAAFTAVTRNRYFVPLVSPVTVAVVALEATRGKRVHVTEGPSTLYSMM